jgi:glycyl-tRNA synthetase beta chain
MSEVARDFLVELGTEELPPLALPELERAFAAGIPVRPRRGWSAAWRATLVRHATSSCRAGADLSVMQPAQSIKLKVRPSQPRSTSPATPRRPRPSSPKNAASTCRHSRVSPKVKESFLYFSGSKPGLTTASVLPGVVQRSLDQLPIPKRMRWGASNAEFVRPVHWLTMLFGSDVIATRMLDTDSGRSTRGHRFMAPWGNPARQSFRI